MASDIDTYTDLIKNFTRKEGREGGYHLSARKIELLTIWNCPIETCNCDCLALILHMHTNQEGNSWHRNSWHASTAKQIFLKDCNGEFNHLEVITNSILI